MSQQKRGYLVTEVNVRIAREAIKNRFKELLMTTTSSSHKSVRHERRTGQPFNEKEFHEGPRKELQGDTSEMP